MHTDKCTLQGIEMRFILLFIAMLSLFSLARAFRSPTLRLNSHAPSYSRHFTSSPLRAVKEMTAQDFQRLLSSPDARALVQIIDVREPAELLGVKLRDADVINLPLSEADKWSSEVEQGERLDKARAVVCLCKIGMRSLKVRR